MFPVMKKASRWNGYIFCLLLGGMFLFSLPQLYTFAHQEEDAVGLYMDGELSRKFEKSYDKDFFIRDASIELWASLQYLIFNEGSSGVVMGKDAWLYTNEEYLMPVDAETVVSRHIDRIKSVRQELSRLGKRLIVIPVPMKVDIYVEHTVVQPHPLITRLYDDFIIELHSAGIEVAPVREAMISNKDKGQMFLVSDTHWTPQGAKVTAVEVARQFPDLIGSQAFITQKVSDKLYPGDLLNFIKASQFIVKNRYRGDSIEIFETSRLNDTIDESRLFDDAPEQIALVGSSYTEIDDWNFPGFLMEALQQDVVAKAVKAEGPFKAMESFLASDLPASEGIQNVLWEFPVRTLLSEKEKRANWQENMDEIFSASL
jgi:alginate O-acetyltransferase complex protein AlgJ